MRSRGQVVFKLTHTTWRAALALWLAAACSALLLTGCRGGGPGNFTPPPSNELGSGFVWLMEGGNPAHTGLVDAVGPQSGTPVRETVRDVFNTGSRLAFGGGMIYASQYQAVGAYDAQGRQAWRSGLQGWASGLAYAPDGYLYVLDCQGAETIYGYEYASTLRKYSSAGQEQGSRQLAGGRETYYRLEGAVPLTTAKAGHYLLMSLSLSESIVSGAYSEVAAYTPGGDQLWNLMLPLALKQLVYDNSGNGRVAVMLDNGAISVIEADGHVPLELDYSDYRGESLPVMQFAADGRLIVVYEIRGDAGAEAGLDAGWYMDVFDAGLALSATVVLPGNYAASATFQAETDRLYIFGQSLDTGGVYGIQTLDYAGEVLDFLELSYFPLLELQHGPGGQFLAGWDDRWQEDDSVYYTLYQPDGSGFGLGDDVSHAVLDETANVIYATGDAGLEVWDADANWLGGYSAPSSTTGNLSLMLVEDGSVLMGNRSGLQAAYQDGTPLWYTELGSAEPAQLASPAGPVIICTGLVDTRQLAALNLGGSELWQTSFQDLGQAGAPYLGEALTDWLADGGGSIYIVGAAPFGTSEITGEALLFSKVDATTGALLWQQAVETAAHDVTALALAGGGLLYAGDRHLLRFSGAGELLKQVDVNILGALGGWPKPEQLIARPDGGCYLVYNGANVASLTADLELEWIYPAVGIYNRASSVALRPAGGFYMCATRVQSRLLAVDEHGRLVFNTGLNDEAPTPALLVDSAGTAYLGLQNGIYAVDSSGALKWSYERANLNCQALALTGNGRLFALTAGRLLEF